MFTAADHDFMQRALQLAQFGMATTTPNPRVGCVVVRDGEIVGEGWHRRAGEPHAEVLALAQAGERARGATAYVTLEPCAHTGATGPCATALVAAGVGRVVAAMRDPFPQVDGRGFDQLCAAGIAVGDGLMATQARALNRAFLSRLERGRPWLRVKLGMSLDGRTAMADGSSKWITGEPARADVMRWRARSGALLTGSGTVLADDPRLTVRMDADVDVVPPLRVVLDPGLATVSRGRIRDGAAPTLYLHAPDVKPPRGLDVERAAVAMDGGGLQLDAVVQQLAARGVGEVQVETGATLAGAFLRAGLVDELLLYVAPVLLGDRGRPLFGGLGIDAMSQRHRLQLQETVHVGDDLRLLLRPDPAATA